MISKFLLKKITSKNYIQPLIKAYSTKENVKSQSRNFDLTGTSLSEVAKEKGLQDYLHKIYGTTALSVAAALGVSKLSIASGFALTNPMGAVFGGLILSIGGIVGFSFSKTNIYYNKEGLPQVENTPLRKLLYGSAITGSGLSISPFIFQMSVVNPLIIPGAVLLTSGVCAGASLFALMKPKGSLLRLGGPLLGGCISLIGISIAAPLIGNPAFMSFAHSLNLWGGTALFTAFMAYDTHVAIQMYEDGNPDYLGCSLNMFINFMALLRRMAEIIYRMTD